LLPGTFKIRQPARPGRRNQRARRDRLRTYLDTGEPARQTPACWHGLRSTGVFFRGGLFIGQERFQDCDVGFDFCDMKVQLGHYLPDFVIP
jgi:hypothetical protein